MLAASLRIEKRAFGRRKTALAAWAKIPGRSPLPCRVTDLSEGGAQLAFHVEPDLPDRFDLEIDTDATVYACVLRRFEGGEAGVEFVAEAEEKKDPVRALEEFARSIPWGRDEDE
jgi:hypothetical protein